MRIMMILAIMMLSNTGLMLFGQAGGSAVPFMLIAPDARASGMGECGTGIADDVNAIYWNPAGLAFLDYFEAGYGYDEDQELEPFKQISLAYSPWLPQFNADLHYSNLSYAQFFEGLNGTIGANFIFMNLGEFEKTDINGNSQGKFRSVEFAISACYATIIAPDLGAAINLKYIQSNLTPTSSGTGDAGTGISPAFDLALMWKPQDLPYLEDRLSLGFNLQNIGPKVTYSKQSDPLPTQLRLGLGIKAFEDEFNEIIVAVDMGKLLVKRTDLGSDPIPTSLYTAWDNPGVELSFGMEYWYQQIIAFRAGYFTEPAQLGNRKFYNIGLGVKYDEIKLDFGYILTIDDNNPLANTMRFSLLYDLNLQKL